MPFSSLTTSSGQSRAASFEFQPCGGPEAHRWNVGTVLWRVDDGGECFRGAQDWAPGESYMAEHEHADDQDFLENSLALHLSDELESDEACALGVESLQAEHEAYHVRKQAKRKGFDGFGMQNLLQRQASAKSPGEAGRSSTAQCPQNFCIGLGGHPEGQEGWQGQAENRLLHASGTQPRASDFFIGVP